MTIPELLTQYESKLRELHAAAAQARFHGMLGEIADMKELRGTNVHTGSRDGGGPLDFDYLLKPGVSRDSNALEIAKLAGVPIWIDSVASES